MEYGVQLRKEAKQCVVRTGFYLRVISVNTEHARNTRSTAIPPLPNTSS